MGNLIALHIKVALGISTSLSGLSVELEATASFVGEPKNWSLVCLLTPSGARVIQFICLLQFLPKKLELSWLEGDFVEPAWHLRGATCQNMENLGAAELKT